MRAQLPLCTLLLAIAAAHAQTTITPGTTAPEPNGIVIGRVFCVTPADPLAWPASPLCLSLI